MPQYHPAQCAALNTLSCIALLITEVTVWDKLRWNTNDPLPTFYLSLPLYKMKVVKWYEVKAFGRNAPNNIVIVFLSPVSVCFLLAISISYCSLRDLPFFSPHSSAFVIYSNHRQCPESVTVWVINGLVLEWKTFITGMVKDLLAVLPTWIKKNTECQWRTAAFPH